MNRHLLRQALDALDAPALIVDYSSKEPLVAYANPAGARRLDFSQSELIGRSIPGLASGAVEPGGEEPWCLKGRSGASVPFRAEPLYEQPGRATFWLLTTPVATNAPAVAPHEDSSTATASRFVRSEERADLTTGMAVRSALQEVLLRDWAIARREQRRISVIVFRIDALESYQTLFGRHATDSCLRRVSHVISSTLQRASDFCGRVAHDRFAVLISGGEEDRIAQFAERIAQRVRDLAIHHPRAQLGKYVTLSWGMASEIPLPDAGEPCLLEDAEFRAGGTGLEGDGAPAVGSADPETTLHRPETATSQDPGATPEAEVG